MHYHVSDEVYRSSPTKSARLPKKHLLCPESCDASANASMVCSASYRTVEERCGSWNLHTDTPLEERERVARKLVPGGRVPQKCNRNGDLFFAKLFALRVYTAFYQTLEELGIGRSWNLRVHTVSTTGRNGTVGSQTRSGNDNLTKIQST